MGRLRMNSLRACLGLGLLFALLVHANAEIVANTQEAPSGAPNKIIIMIGDGMGPAYTSAYRYYMDDPSTDVVETTVFDRLLTGMQSTYPAKQSGYVTDSAASATAIATGEKSYNGAISVDTHKKPIKTLMETAKEQGMAIGVAVTVQINHATPAAFLAHNESRRNYKQLTQSYLESNADVLLGGGQKYFSKEQLAQFTAKGYRHLTDLNQLASVESPPVIGLFAKKQLPWEKNSPKGRLSQLTKKALELLNQNEKGFVLLVEGSLIDWAGHNNDITAAMGEMHEFAQSVSIVEQFVKQHSDALMVVTADHSTGGLTIGANDDYAWHPEVIQKVTATPDKLADIVLNNDSWQQKLEAGLGFKLVAKEAQALAKIKAQIVKENTVSANKKTSYELQFELALGISRLIDLRSNTGWTTLGHTGVDVQVFAAGQQAQLFNGHMDNTDIADKLNKVLAATR